MRKKCIERLHDSPVLAGMFVILFSLSISSLIVFSYYYFNGDEAERYVQNIDYDDFIKSLNETKRVAVNFLKLIDSEIEKTNENKKQSEALKKSIETDKKILKQIVASLPDSSDKYTIVLSIFLGVIANFATDILRNIYKISSFLKREQAKKEAEDAFKKEHDI